MQLNVVFIATAVLASASLGMSQTTVTLFDGADCTGNESNFNLQTPFCLSLGTGSTKSIAYTNVVNDIEFFVNDDNHNSCTNGPQTIFGSGSGCGTAPDGFNWESVLLTG